MSLVQNNNTCCFFLRSSIRSSLILSSSWVCLTSAKAPEAFLAMDSRMLVKFLIVYRAVASTFYRVCTSFSSSSIYFSMVDCSPCLFEVWSWIWRFLPSIFIIFKNIYNYCSTDYDDFIKHFLFVLGEPLDFFFELTFFLLDLFHYALILVDKFKGLDAQSLLLFIVLF